MEKAHSTNTIPKPSPEPGRRYNASHVRPRAGADVISHSSSHAIQPPQPGVTATDVRKPASKRPVAKTRPALPRTDRSMVLKRQMVERAEEYQHKKKESQKRHYLWFAVSAVMVVAFGTVVWSFRSALPFELNLFENRSTVTHTPEVTVSEPTSSLDETEPTSGQITANQVAADAPKILKIPKISIEAKIRQVGSTLTNEPVSPTNIFDVGWYDASGRPGDMGAVLFNGHTAGPTKPGIFAHIHQLTAGDQILLERGDGQLLTYVVSKVQEYSLGQIDMAAATRSIDPAKHGLNLVTTTTKYSGNQKRVIVFALLR